MESESQQPPTGGDIPLLPARMVNAFAYCPPLAYFEWVDGEFADNAETTEGFYGSLQNSTAEMSWPHPGGIAELYVIVFPARVGMNRFSDY